jgi:hypothetical protein
MIHSFAFWSTEKGEPQAYGCKAGASIVFGRVREGHSKLATLFRLERVVLFSAIAPRSI